MIGALKAHNEELTEQVRDLLEHAGKSSRNSSRAPSSDSPAQRAQRAKKPRSTRAKGAQPGHERHERALLPEADLDQIRHYLPEGGCRCGATLAIEAEPACRHQVFDLPPVRYHVTEHRLHAGRCRRCGRREVARAPRTVPSGQMGPGLVAWIALMSAEHHLSVRQIQRLLTEQWQLHFSLGAISAAQGIAAEALERPYGAIGEHVRAQAVAHADETRHPRGGGGYPSTWWLWTLTAGAASVFGVHLSRGKAAARELLGEFDGVLVTDDLGSYSVVPEHRRQLCWAHLMRHFIAIGERPGRGGAIGRRLLLLARATIRTRHRFERGEIDPERYRRRIGRLRGGVRDQLERGARLRLDGRTRRQCRHLLGREPMLWTFASDPAIGLTNNAAERALRPFVIWRKVAYASHSRRGDRFRERALSVVMTARGLGVPVYGYLRRVCAEALEPGGVRTLLPLDPPRLSHAPG